MKKSKTILTLFTTFFKIGLFTFGGGYSMIPMIQHEICTKHKYINEEDMLNMVAISETTPGPIAPNIATFVGYKTAGMAGAVIATLGLTLPSFIIIILIAKFFHHFSEYQGVKFAFNGIRVCVVVLMIKALITLWKPCPKSRLAYIIMAVAFIAVAVLNINAIIIVISSAAIGVAAFLLAKKEDKSK